MRLAITLFSLSISLSFLFFGAGGSVLSMPKPVPQSEVLAMAISLCPPNATGLDALNCLNQAELATAGGAVR